MSDENSLGKTGASNTPFKKIEDLGQHLYDTGLLFEINRKVLHPRGLAIGTNHDDDDAVVGMFLRDVADLEGIVFGEASWDEGRAKLSAFDESRNHLERVEARQNTYGEYTQTIPK